MSAKEVIVYREGITGSHFGVGEIDQRIIPLQVSSLIVDVLRLLTAAFRVHRSLMWSWISVPSAYNIQLRASWACDQCVSVLLPNSIWMESLAIPVVITPNPATSVQLSVMWPLASWLQKFHSSRVGVLE